MAYLSAKVVMEPGAGDRMDGLIDRLEQAIGELGQIMAERAATLAKQLRTWTDRTSNARQGLAGRATVAAGKLTIYLFHGMYYGIFLELANSGRYAVIMRTLQQIYPQVMRMISRLMSGG